MAAVRTPAGPLCQPTQTGMNHAVPASANSRPVRSVGRSTAHKSPAAINPKPAANWATIAIGEVAPYVVTHGMLRHAGSVAGASKNDGERYRHASEDAHIGIVAPMIGCSDVVATVSSYNLSGDKTGSRSHARGKSRPDRRGGSDLYGKGMMKHAIEKRMGGSDDWCRARACSGRMQRSIWYTGRQGWWLDLDGHPRHGGY